MHQRQIQALENRGEGGGGVKHTIEMLRGGGLSYDLSYPRPCIPEPISRLAISCKEAGLFVLYAFLPFDVQYIIQQSVDRLLRRKHVPRQPYDKIPSIVHLLKQG